MSNTKSSAPVVHPGQYVRQEALMPAKLSIKAAAELIGISRPNVSNFINGKAGATPDMAARIERVFQIPAKTILDMQAAYDASQAKAKGVPTTAKAYVPPFLSFKANDIESWATSNISARNRLSVFLRRLVNSTGVGLLQVDFPGNDDAERPGWDGYVEAEEGTPWIPLGLSGWEFGVNQDIKSKADKDFSKSVAAHDEPLRKQTTFVFVTPRRWVGKDAWIKEAKQKNLWNDVRVYDSSDLEQWLEQSLAGQAWFANEIRFPIDDVRSLDKCWEEWTEATITPLPSALFNTALEASKRAIISWLSTPPKEPFIIAADSSLEALAFTSVLFGPQGGEELERFRDRVIVFDKTGTLPKLAQGAQTFIPITITTETSKELAPLSRKMHCISVCSRNTANAAPNIILEPVPSRAFREVWQGVGKDTDEITRLENISGRSLTVLRRQLSNVPAVKTPGWASERKVAESLVPFLFVGVWDGSNETDRAALSLLSNKDYVELEKETQYLSQISDAPMWSIGGFRGVVSKIDLLFAIAPFITKDDLARYFSLARLVLGEDDPSIDLPESERWAAYVHGKVREFSAAFRNGIAETLVLLAVYGNDLFKSRLGMDLESEAAAIVRHLLSAPLTLRKLEANNQDLPTYAEAAPDAFLSIIETDLKSAMPVTLGLLRPAESGGLGRSPSRTGLLWALEGLAWKPENLPRVALILAKLAEIEINDNWVNKPHRSLVAIFKSWMPQTAASKNDRIAVIKKIVEKFPSVGWKLCVSLYKNHSDIGEYSHKPKWRPDGFGFGEPLKTRGDVIDFVRDVIEITLSYSSYTLSMVCDLITRLDALDEDCQTRVWEVVKVWAATASDEDKASLREKLRVTTLSQRAVRRAKKKERSIALSQTAKDVYLSLEPSDLINKHAWLFKNSWLDESYDEIHGGEEIDFKKRDERTAELRATALREIREERGNEGIFDLSQRGEASGQIGALLANHVLSNDELTAFLKLAWGSIDENNAAPRRGLIAGVLGSVPNEVRKVLVDETTRDLPDIERADFLILAPFCQSTWRIVDVLKQDAQTRYWQNIHAHWVTDEETEEAIERFLMAERPRAAFAISRYRFKHLSAQILYRLMSEVAKGGKDASGHYLLEEYSVQEAFKQINKSQDITLDEKAGLELAYIEALTRPWDERGDGIPNLEKYIEQNPGFFVQAIAWMYKRSDGGTDPVEFQVAPENIQFRAKQGYNIIEGVKRIPGHNSSGQLEAAKLLEWTRFVRNSCADLGRGEVGDLSIGTVLSASPKGADDVWPCEAVRDVLEDIQSEEIMRGMSIGVYNSRGVHARGEGGNQEREIASKYRNWAEALRYTHPYVSSRLLMEIVKSYEFEADREDREAGIRRRLR